MEPGGLVLRSNVVPCGRGGTIMPMGLGARAARGGRIGPARGAPLGRETGGLTGPGRR